MPWLSRSPSPASSQTGSPNGRVYWSSLTYIPPLIDGACGTTLRGLHSPLTLLQKDISIMMRVMPDLAWSILSGFVVRGGTNTTWADRMDVFVQVALALVETCILATLVPLWLVLPGLLFALLLCAFMSTVLVLSRVLHTKQRVVRCNRDSEGWMMGAEPGDERWIVIEGLDISSRYFSKSTLPTLSRLFRRPVTGICTPSYGIPLDLLTLLFRRCTSMSSTSTRVIHTQLRTTLLDSSINRVVVLAHNVGAASLAHAVAQLHADIPANRLSKLEIYTFGAAAAEFAIPTGDVKCDAPSSPAESGSPQHRRQQRQQQQRQQDEGRAERAERAKGPYIEHFAFSNDPFARIGVLHHTHLDLLSRFCGGVFVIESPIGSSTTTDLAGPTRTPTAIASPTASPTRRSSPRSPHRSSAVPSGGQRRGASGSFALQDYLTALFPAQMEPKTTRRSALDTVLAVDRDVAEKREFLAMSNYAAGRTGGAGVGVGGKRLSWTGLGATVGRDGNGVMDGVMGLEAARRGCRVCDGRRGGEVSRLARYIHGGRRAG